MGGPVRPGYWKEYYRRNEAKMRAKTIAHGRASRLAVLTHYSGGDIKCACCGEREYVFLVLDHINGGGEKHRREVKRTGIAFYRWIIVNGFPEGYRILCNNCNASRGYYGYCPHESAVDPIWAEA